MEFSFNEYVNMYNCKLNTKFFYSYNPDIICKEKLPNGKKYTKLKISNSFIIFMLVIFFVQGNVMQLLKMPHTFISMLL